MRNSIDNKVNRYVFLSFILLLGIFLLYSLMAFFTAFLTAIIFYVLSTPFTTWLTQKRKWKKSSAAIVVIIISFFLILVPISLFATLLYSKLSVVMSDPQIIMDNLEKVTTYIHDTTGVELVSEKNLATLQTFTTSVLSAILNEGVNLFSTIIMMYFFLYFMISNKGRMEAAIRLYLPFSSDKIKIFGNELVAQTFGNAVGIPLIAVAQGLAGYISFFIAGVDEAGFWGVICGFASVIPVVGTGLVWVPVTLYLLILGDTWQGIFVAAWGLLVLGVVDNVIRFLLAKRMADVHPIVTVLGVIIGLRYFGFAGLIYGPLLISFFIILLRIYYQEYTKPRLQKQSKPLQLVPSYMQPFLGTKKSKSPK